MDNNLPDSTSNLGNDSTSASISPTPESLPIPEKKAEETVETIISTPEVEKAPEVSQPEQKPPSVPSPKEQSVVEEISPQLAEHIVDKRNHHMEEKHLKTDHPLTAEADKEEEDFIEHVDEVHSIT